jgi:hypothetical protein
VVVLVELIIITLLELVVKVVEVTLINQQQLILVVAVEVELSQVLVITQDLLVLVA